MRIDLVENQARGPAVNNCIDLETVFGRLHQIKYEPSYNADRGKAARLRDPWVMTIPCRHGHIFVHGGDYLAASTNHRGPIATQLAALPCTTVLQDGDDGINAAFHLGDFDQVAAVMKPKARRQLTPDQRAERTERLRKY